MADRQECLPHIERNGLALWCNALAILKDNQVLVVHLFGQVVFYGGFPDVIFKGQMDAEHAEQGNVAVALGYGLDVSLSSSLNWVRPSLRSSTVKKARPFFW